jgi:DNA-binding MarR family transcriptional regulator
MSVIEKRVIILDEQRVLVLEDKTLEELHGPRLKGALRAFGLDRGPHGRDLEPAPDRHPVMPRGITRKVTTRQGYHEYRHSVLFPAGHKVLRGVAEMDKPVTYHEMVGQLSPKVPRGTVSSQLSLLSKAGYLLKQHDTELRKTVYTITTEGEEVLTRPLMETLDPADAP